MRVLLHNHTALVSGAERSLLELVAGLGGAGVEPVVASPDGPLAERVRALGAEHVVVPGAAATLKLHPVRTPAALGGMGRAAAALRRAARRAGADIVHANTARAGLVAAAARATGGPPVVVHLRDVVPPGPIGRAVAGVAVRQAAVVAISRHVAGPLGDAPRVRVIHNPVDLERFDPARVDAPAARAALGLAPGVPVLAVVAQITSWKGQHVAIEALAHVRRGHPGARLLLAGEVKFTAPGTTLDNAAYARSLHALVAERGLGDAVAFLGEREDVPELLAAADLLLVPSTEEPFGRTVVEAMAMGTPVLATARGGPAEVLSDGREGLLLDPGDADAWGRAAARVLDDDALRRAMGERGRAAAARFGRDAYARTVAALYREVAR